jgi:hypothetical protein
MADEMRMDIAVKAGEPSLLVHLREVRIDVAIASVTATRVAAGAPHMSAARKTNTSPGVIEVCVPGNLVG